jgi:5-formyltetrahydrofolate cyclo-ligase
MYEKGVLRALVREARAGRPGRVIDPALATQVPHWQRVGAYRPLPGEPNLEPFLAALPHVTLMLPRIAGTALAWVEVSGDTEFEIGPFGVRQPIGSDATEAATTADALLIPALAVDVSGRRLGQGGGYYDRFLATLPVHGGPLRVAVVADDEVMQEIPDEPHDARVNAILTPTRFIPLTSGTHR